MGQSIDSRQLARMGTLRQLEIFLKVAEVGGIAQAAEQLHLSQPSVSIQVRKLAEAVGLPLYEVVGKKLKLTDAGRRVERAGWELLDTFHRLQCDINDLKGLQTGRLRLSVDSSAKYFLPQLLGPFLQRYPGVELDFVEGKRSELLQRFNNNLDDLYIFNHIPESLDITHHPFLPNPLVVVARDDHPLARKRGIRWPQLNDERLIVREPGSGSRLALDQFLRQRELQLARPLELASSEAIRLSVMHGMGVGIVSAYALFNAEAEHLVRLRVEGFPILTQWHIAHPRDKQLSNVAQRFLEFMLEEGEQHLPMETIRRRVREAG